MRRAAALAFAAILAGLGVAWWVVERVADLEGRRQ
jgi:hypothetical protein